MAEASELLHVVESGVGSSALSALPVQRDAGTCDDLGEILQQILVCAQPEESAALLAQLSQLEAKAAHLETVQAELRGLADILKDAPRLRVAAQRRSVRPDDLLRLEVQDTGHVVTVTRAHMNRQRLHAAVMNQSLDAP